MVCDDPPRKSASKSISGIRAGLTSYRYRTRETHPGTWAPMLLVCQWSARIASQNGLRPLPRRSRVRTWSNQRDPFVTWRPGWIKIVHSYHASLAPVKFLGEIHSISKDSGKFLVTPPFPYWLRQFLGSSNNFIIFFSGLSSNPLCYDPSNVTFRGYLPRIWDLVLMGQHMTSVEPLILYSNKQTNLPSMHCCWENGQWPFRSSASHWKNTLLCTYIYCAWSNNSNYLLSATQKPA